MNSLVAAGAGFLLAILWFDLMFDVQSLRGPEGPLPEAVLSSIAGYYRRVTTTARPMDRLIALIMLVTLGAIIVEIVRGDVSAWVGWISLVLAAAPITLAATRTLPRAVRLGAREDTVDRQSALARSVGRDSAPASRRWDRRRRFASLLNPFSRLRLRAASWPRRHGCRRARPSS